MCVGSVLPNLETRKLGHSYHRINVTHWDFSDRRHRRIFFYTVNSELGKESLSRPKWILGATGFSLLSLLAVVGVTGTRPIPWTWLMAHSAVVYRSFSSSIYSNSAHDAGGVICPCHKQTFFSELKKEGAFQVSCLFQILASSYTRVSAVALFSAMDIS